MKKKPFVVFLDAGHGGLIDGRYVTPGKRSPIMHTGCRIYEGVFNRWVCDRAASYLCIPGIEVIYDEYNYDKPIGARVRRINDLDPQPDLVVSVHANAFGDGGWEDSVYGPRALVARSKPRKAYRAAAAFLKIFDGKYTSISDPVPRTSQRRLGILEATKAPAILVELGFMTSSFDFHRMVYSSEQYVIWMQSWILALRDGGF